MSTKDKLVETAARLFADNGYGATGMAEILRKAGVHRGSLYHAFPAKKDLLVAVLERYRNGMDVRLIEPAWRGVRDPIERVFALLDRYRAFLVDSQCMFGCPIGSLALELHAPDAEIRALLVANFDAWTRKIEECFLAVRGQFQAGTDFRALALFALTTMEGGVMLARTHRSLKHFDSAVATFRDYIDLLRTADPGAVKVG
jgi:TetR/AcrR family transcriptional regulator, transcriptional repressor for nem operon